MTISPAQVRAARAMLGWKLEDLAAKADVALQTLYRFEHAATRPHPRTGAKLRQALEAAGVQFIDAPEGGVGVLLVPPTGCG